MIELGTPVKLDRADLSDCKATVHLLYTTERRNHPNASLSSNTPEWESRPRLYANAAAKKVLPARSMGKLSKDIGTEVASLILG